MDRPDAPNDYFARVQRILDLASERWDSVGFDADE